MGNAVTEKHSSFKTAFPIASAWFGALVGPSMVSGVYALVYFAPYGAWGVPLAFIAMVPIAILAAMNMNVIRQHKTYDYSSFAMEIYGKAYKVLMPIYDFYVMLSMVLGGGAVISMGGTFFAQLFGLPEILGSLLMAALSIVIVVWGAKMIRVTSTAMTIVLVVCFVTLFFYAVGSNMDTLGNIFATWYVPDTANLGNGLYRAIIIGFSNFGFVSGMCSIEQNVRTKKDCVVFCIIAIILNGFAWALTCLMLLPYCPDILTQSVPVLYILQQYVLSHSPAIYYVYMLAMFLALLSSGAPQLFAIVPRIQKFMAKFRDPNKVYSEKKDNLIIGIAYFAFVIVVSLLGLITIVSQGYTFGGQLGFCIVGIPVIIYYLRGKHKEKAKQEEQSN